MLFIDMIIHSKQENLPEVVRSRQNFFIYHQGCTMKKLTMYLEYPPQDVQIYKSSKNKKANKQRMKTGWQMPERNEGVTTTVKHKAMLLLKQVLKFLKFKSWEVPTIKEAGNCTSADRKEERWRLSKKFIISWMKHFFSWIPHAVTKCQTHLWKNWHNPSSSSPVQSPGASEWEWCHWGKHPPSSHGRTVGSIDLRSCYSLDGSKNKPVFYWGNCSEVQHTI